MLTCSALEDTGLAEVWHELTRHREHLAGIGELTARRGRQQVSWVWALVRDSLMDGLIGHPVVRGLVPDLEQAVAGGGLPPAVAAAQRILAAYRGQD